jgi:hypothetical protein
MAVEKPLKVEKKNITSTDIVSFNGGLDERGEANAEPNTFVYGRNVMVNLAGLLTHRFGLKKWLPDTVGTVYDVFPAVYGGVTYNIVADDGRIRYCLTGATAWTNALGADTAAVLTTALTGTNNDLVFTAVQSGYESNLARGVNGNNVRIRYVNPGAANRALSVVVTANTDITVNLATNGASAITTTSAQIRTAIAAHADAKKLVVATNAGGNDGTGVVIALAYTNLAGGASGSNWVTTGNGTIPTFLRIQDKVLILNGVDKLGYLNLTNMTVVKFTSVTNPATQPSATATVLTLTGNPKIYYATNWNSTVGQTALSPIRTYDVSKTRGTWKSDGTEFLTIDRVNSVPSGAVSWNLWIALAKSGASIQPSDMLLLAGGIDIASATFVDNGTLPIDISRGTAPEDNSTDGMIASYGVEDKGRPILYGDPTAGKEQNLYIGGDGDNALDFSPTNGGYVVELNKGTNYYPQGVIGFRNGQGIPSMTVLFSNTQGLSKQTIIEQQTVTYGTQSFVVWTQTEQNYGAAGVSSPYAVINYLGKLIFPTTDGIVSMDTEASMQNVLSSKRISDKASKTVASIKNSALPLVVGTAWSNRVLMSVPSRGYNFNNEILVYDMTNDQKPVWYTLDIRAQWIGTVSPRQESAFVYICQDNHIFRLEQSYVALDENSDGTTTPFPVSAKGALIGTNQAHNGYVSVVQVMFYLVDFIGEIEIGVTYRNEVGIMKTKSKMLTRGAYAKSSGGGWSSPPYVFKGGESPYLRWGEFPNIADAELAVKDTIREPLVLNVLTSELQWFINTNLDNSSFILRSVSYEGINVGVRGDLR